MLRHLLMAFVLLSLVACQGGGSATARQSGSGSDGAGDIFGDTGGGNKDMAADLTDALKDASKNLSGPDAEDLAKTAQSTLGPVGTTAEQIAKALEGSSASAAQQAARNYLAALAGLNPLVELLRRLNLDTLADIAYRLSLTIPAYKLYHPTNKRNFVAKDFGDAIDRIFNWKFRPNGVSFLYYTRQYAEYTQAIYRCRDQQSGVIFASNRADCDGKEMKFQYGFLSPRRDPIHAPLAVERWYNPKETDDRFVKGNYVVTRNRKEADFLKARGFVLQATIGYSR